MIIVAQDSKAAKFYDNLTKANRLTASLPSFPRAVIWHYCKNKGQFIETVDSYPDDNIIIAHFHDCLDNKWTLAFTVELCNYQPKWKYEELVKHGTKLNYDQF